MKQSVFLINHTPIKENMNLMYNDKLKQNRPQVLIPSCILFSLSLLLFMLFALNTKSNTLYDDEEKKFELLAPRPMIGHCNGTCVPNQAYPCIFSSFYPVTFTEDGKWRWDCPFLDGSRTEVGMARMLSQPHEKVYPNGSWSARWYGGNQIQSDPNKRVHCACYYVGGEGEGKSWIFKSFETKIVKYAENESIESVCKSFTGCPKTEKDAYHVIGSSPWIEKFFDCKKD